MNLEAITKFARCKFGNTGCIAVDENLMVHWYSLNDITQLAYAIKSFFILVLQILII